MKLTEKQLDDLVRDLTNIDEVRRALKAIAEHFSTMKEVDDYVETVLDDEYFSEYLERVSDRLGCIRKEKVLEDINCYKMAAAEDEEYLKSLSTEERLLQAIFGPPLKEEE